jgi:hypothetical protein
MGRLSRPLLTATTVLVCTAIPAQAGVNTWTRVGDGPFGGTLDLVAPDPATGLVYAHSRESGVFRSLDGAGSWSPYAVPPGGLNAFLRHADQAYWGGVGLYTSPGGANAVWTPATPGVSCTAAWPPQPTSIGALAVVAGTLYAGTLGSGVFSSPATGTPAWTDASSGLPFGPTIGGGNCAPDVLGFAADDARLYAATSRGVYSRPLDGTAEWLAQNTGLSTPPSLTDPRVVQIALKDGALLAIGYSVLAAGSGVLYRSAAAATLDWAEVSIAATDPPAVQALLVSNGSVFVGTDRGVLTSTSGESGSWSPASAGLVGFAGVPLAVHSLATDGTQLFAGTRQGLYRSPAAAPIQWEPASLGLQVQPTVIAAAAGQLLLGTLDGAFTSPIGGPFSWQPANDGLTDEFSSVRRVDFIGGDANGFQAALQVSTPPVFQRTADNLTPWSPLAGPTPGIVSDILVVGSVQYVATFNGVYVSVAGAPAVAANAGLPVTALGGPAITGFATNGARVFAATTAGIHVSQAGSPVTWSAFDGGLTELQGVVQALVIVGDTLYAATTNGVYTSPASGTARWRRANDGLVDDAGAPAEVTDFAVTDTALFALTGRTVYVATLDDDLGWLPASAGLGPDALPSDLAGEGGTVYAATPVGVFAFEYAPAQSGGGGSAVDPVTLATLLALVGSGPGRRARSAAKRRRRPD